ncbi:APC family permease [Nocardioides aurantiacus]|uniref:Amino acid/polyamine/organocation transporter (APC superfamily) n=1 Tax=Nocardioides aurantiacus TaxID=86796 RepID=A0A3N2CQF7_9ACTN|nr:APC family permease [Nocardioides aurantiacus]ROR89719.1 amino acid/polyamine/organocation transporter (APC superfamily) [Nocardioides aurantiacus]
MSDTSVNTSDAEPDGDLKRSITGRLLFFYVLGDVLGSGIYVLIGSVAAAVGGAFFVAFAVGVTIATVTGMAYAELATKYPRAAGAALYINKAFGNKPLTFLVTVLFLASSFAAAGSLATGFASYFAEVWAAPPILLVSLVFIALLAVVNYIGITESVVANMVMTFVEVFGLVIVMIIGVVVVFQGDADFAVLGDFSAEGNPIFAVVAGVSLAFFAMTGFENAANVAEEVVDPARNFPRALIGGMAGAGIFYVLVSIAAALTVPVGTLADSDAALLTVVESGVLPLPVGVVSIVFAIIAMTAITNTTLVAIVTQPRVLYGMAREDVVPAVFGKVHPTRRSPVVGLIFSAAVVMILLSISQGLKSAGLSIDVVARLASVTVVLLLIIYSMVIIACMKLGTTEVNTEHYRAPRPLLVLGLVGNLAVLFYTVQDDPTSVIWCLGLIAVGVALFVFEYFFGKRDRPSGLDRGEQTLGEESR